MHVYILHNIVYYTHIYFPVVPDPIIIMDAHYSQVVSKPLTLDCNITAVRGITSRVDIVWSSNGLELKKIEGIESNLTQGIGNSVLYMDSYTIPRLGTVDEGRTYQCGIIINQAMPIIFNGNITLDVTGEVLHNHIVIYTFNIPVFVSSQNIH